ncbi:MAG: hypothetical protein WC682_01415 [Parcubacteria group bacterium]|jgi:hypothetical protein
MSKFQKLLLILVFTIIGLSSASLASAATQIYRSVASGVTATLATDSSHANTVTVTSGTATFSAALPDNIGVGDAVLIDTGGTDQTIDASDTLLFIHARASSTSYTLKTHTGATPSDISINDTYSIYRAYTSLSNAEAGTKNTNIPITFNGGDRNLVTNDEVWNFACYAAGTTADTAMTTIDSWTTDSTRYMRIYTPVSTTEVGTSQRHSGKWDESKYYISIGNNSAGIYYNIKYLVIDGIQIKVTSSDSSGSVGIQAYNSSIVAGGEITIKNNIVRGQLSGTDPGSAGIATSGYSPNSGVIKIFNNIVYDFARVTGTPQAIFFGAGDHYIYNNTIINCYGGLYKNGGSSAAVAKNNIVKGATDAYYGTFTTGTDYNATDGTDDIGTGSNNKISQTFSFIDETNDDFHLSSTDTAARNSGIDLATDTYSPFATDIDGAGRSATVNAWDIGADETATQIFRSVGPSATAVLESDTSHARTVTLTSGVATFSVALADDIGVGDAVLIDTGGTSNAIDASDTILFISARNSSTSYNLQTHTGAAPSDITINDTYSIYRAYTSLSLAEAGTKNTSIPITFNGGNRDLVTNNEEWNLACYANGVTADTTSVTVAGWTTAQQDFIKIYTPVTTTEVGTSQRHGGKWDMGKYNLTVDSGSWRAITNEVSYMTINGLQISKDCQNNNDSNAVRDQGVGGLVNISNNIIKETSTNSLTASQGVRKHWGSGTVLIWNNIIYGWHGTGNYVSGIVNASASAAYLYGYNNTIYDCNIGIRRDTGTIIAKNNITQNCTDGYSGTFDSSSDYNISDLASDNTGGAHDKQATVAFADTANKDFHLAPTDTQAKNSGADLSADANLPFTTDIDGQTRSATPGWDIGADEAANAVYYSVGQSTADLKTGSPNVAITAGVATFDVAQTGNIGVGDVVVANAISYYISSKTSTTVWNVVTVTGATPTNITSTAVTSIKHVYTSLNSAVSGASTLLGTTDLYTNNYQINIPCYYDSAADTTAVTVSGYTTAVPNYIKIYTPYNTTTESNNSQRHSGKWDATKYRLVTTLGNISVSYVNNVKIDGLQLESQATVARRVIIMIGSNMAISNNILRYSGAAPVEAIFCNSTQTNIDVWNNIVYGFANGGDGIYITNNNNGSARVYNNIVYGGTYGITTGNTDIIAKNNISYNNTTYDFSSGTFHSTSTNNLSKDATAPPLNTYYTSKTLAFTSTTAGAEDFHLVAADTDAINKGADLSADTNLAFSTDIDSQTRNLRSEGWDIGADEAATQIFYSVGQNTSDHKTGSPLVTVSGTTATFDTAQTATNMGVGDLVTYTGGTCYISAKTSTTVWSCLSVTGGAPTAATNASVTSIAHAFASLEGAVDADMATGAFDATHLNTKDLVAGNYQLNVPCYYDSGADTTAVVVRSWTTGAQDYIRIYTPVSTTTEVNQTQRHSGKWDSGKYNMLISSGASGKAIYVANQYIRIDGLQIKTVGYGGIWSNVIYGAKGQIISNNIIWGSGTFTAAGQGIGWFGNVASVSAYNNIIYGFTYAGSYGIRLDQYTQDKTPVVYNNTVYGCDTGILQDADAYYSNNIAYNNGVDFSGTSRAGSTNNLSKDGTATGTNAKINQTVAFTSTASGSEDFHLASTDTAAKNSGADLSADANLPFATDIDGASRNASINAWDIGADETATQIFYSVGQNTSDHKTGSPTVTVSGTTATFDTAQTATNMGVGDLVTYTGGTCYISAKTSTSVWSCVSATGGTPTVASGANVTSIAHAFSALSTALDADSISTSAGNSSHLNTNNLVTGNYQLNVPCYYDSGPDVGAYVRSWTTGAQNHIKIYTPVSTTSEANQTQRHSGKWDNTKYSINATGLGQNINSWNIDLVIEGLQIYKYAADGYTSIITVNPAAFSRISANIFKGDNNFGSAYGISGGSASLNVNIYDNVFQDFRSPSSYFWTINPAAGNWYVYNNTFYNCHIALRGISGMVAKNNIVQNCVDGYDGTFNSASDYNISDLASDNTGGAHDKQATVAFADTANKDFHLAPTDTAAKNSGADLSADAYLPFATDIDGQTRSATPSWDIGADEAANAVYYSVGQSTADLKTGTPNVAITSGVATFDVAQTGNIGVGDVMIANAISYYISSKTSTTVWNVVTNTGATPTDITSTAVTSIKHVYTSLNSASSGAGTLLGTTDLYTNNYQINIPCYYDGAADTTSVTVSGYTTAVPNYIKIYTPYNTTTESNNSQRHSGKWDDAKYRLVSASPTTVQLNSSYIMLEGIQLKNTNTTSGADTAIIYTSLNNANSLLTINKNIVVAQVSGVGTMYAFKDIYQTTKNAIFSNNSFYNITGGTAEDRAIIMDGGNFYIYNNTIYNAEAGLKITYSSTVIAKNNIVQGATDGYYGTFDSSSDYNISNLSSDTTGGAHDKQATVVFISTTAGVEDFHLALTDTAARNSGVDLSADTSFAFTTDIDSQTRNQNALGWDIGADEAATQIFYSVGQNTTDHKTGTPLVTVAGTMATFDTAQTATNMGVGDLVTYTGGTCYISAKTSSTIWSCISATGGTPTAVINASVTSIAHAFASLEGAVDAGTASGAFDASHLNTKDIMAGNFQLNIPCYYDSGADTTAVTVQSWTTGAQNYLKIYTPNNTTSEVNQTQRHAGKWDDTKYDLKISTNAHNMQISISYIHIDGLQIYQYADNSAKVSLYVYSPNTGIEISNNIIRGRGSYTTGTHLGINIATSNKIWNNIIYNFNVTGSVGINSTGSYTNQYIYNNTIYNCAVGIARSNATVILKNNIAYNNGTDYSGTFDASSTNNLSKDATAPPLNTYYINKTLAFTNVTSGAEDFHLATTDTDAINKGADLSADTSLSFTTDIDGAGRIAAVNAWDIGADETATQIYRSVAPSATAVLESDTSHARTVTITSGVATFSNALSDTIGVGDAVLIDTGGTDQTIDASDTILFISSRNSATSYNLQTHTGATPSDITINDTYSIYRAYTSVSLAEAGTKNTSIPITFNGGNRDLVTNNEQWNLACYANGVTADTTSVIITGWTTAQQDFIKIYTPVSTTEVGTSQRHGGKWDSGFFRMENISYSLYISVDNIVIDGIQFYNSNNVGNSSGIYLTGAGGIENITFSGNIFRGLGSYSDGNLHSGISATGLTPTAGSVVKIYNNIVYDFSGSSLSGIGINAVKGTRTYYIYNNTVYNIVGYGINNYSAAAVVAKNNIVQNCTDGYVGTFTSSDYNISDIAADNTGGAHDKQATVAFADTANKDFHLAPTDTAAKNSGVDLSADANLPITTDIDGQTRIATPGFDIGADEAANAVYYSVGQSTADLKTGTPNVSIASGTATFDVGQTANIGVGDVMIANAISYYISSKTSTTVWNVVTVTGTTPTNITSTAVTSIKHVYSSLNSASSGAGTLLGTSDLYTNNYQINIPCYYDSAADTTAVTVQNYTTAVPNYIKIYTPNNTVTESNNSQRHSGKWDTGKYSLSNSAVADALRINNNNVVIAGLQINQQYNADYYDAIAVGADNRNAMILQNILKDSGATNSGNAVYVGNSTNTSIPSMIYIVNNVAYGWKSDAINVGGVGDNGAFVYNNTLYGNGTCGINQNSYYDVVAKNNVVNSSGTYGYCTSHLSTPLNYATSSTNNISSDATALGSNSKINATVKFISTTSGSEDLHLSPEDKMARDFGADLSVDANFAFSTDVDGSVRTVSWDAGADETATQIFYSVGQNTTDHSIGSGGATCSTTGACTITIAGGMATFNYAQTATNLGVGDKVTYNTTSVAYITQKISQTQWKLMTATGGVPADVGTAQTLNSITHAFASLEGAVDADNANGAFDSTHLNTKDLVIGNYQLNVPCYYDTGADTMNVILRSWKTSTQNYIKMYTPNNTTSEVNQSQRHNGKWDATKYSLSSTGLGSNLYTADNSTGNGNVIIEGIQFYRYSASNFTSVLSLPSTKNSFKRISSNIFKGEVNYLSSTYVISGGVAGADVYIYNNIFQDFKPASGYVWGFNPSAGNWYVYNNTFYNCDVAIRRGASNNMYVKNNITQNCTDGYYGTFDASSDYNISDLAADTAGGVHDKQATVAFIDATNKDFCLKTSDTAARYAGINLSTDSYLPFTNDIRGKARPKSPDAWSIGACENLDSTKVKMEGTQIKLEGDVKFE